MKRARLTLMLLTLSAALCTATALAADYTTITLDVSVDRSADSVWRKIGGFCDIGAWIKMSCTYASGSGDLGTVRRLGDRIVEVMVGKSRHSYTYTQPDSKTLYHGTLEVEPVGANRSRIIYRLFYDQSDLASAQAREAARAQRTKVFSALLATMKRAAEGP
ncbi:MAG TPA: SRPBCC family protein [Steroidobacteraceae bacterium]|nr:SRPBCC family protein [Steroidobacteraceae bacterium]